MDRPVGLMILIAVLSAVLELYWLVAVMAVGIVLIMIASIEMRKPVAVPAGGREEEVLTPVVVQDIGEPPYLYPPNFDLKVNPNENLMPLYEMASKQLGKLVRTGIRTARGDRYRKLKPSKVKWRQDT